jgi:uncharacterized protein with beta-barrel porin domain
MSGGRQSDHRLILNGGGWLNLGGGEYRFSGGTYVNGGTLVVWDTLESDVFVNGNGPGEATLWLTGTIRGDVENNRLVSLRHRCGTGLNLCLEDRRARIEGNYRQSASAQLEVVLGWGLHVTGTANLDGMLVLIGGTSQSYVHPSAPTSLLVMHAERGIAGAFDGWSAEELGWGGIFIEGSLSYDANDVYFNLTRISLADAMGQAQSDALTLASAGRIENALAHADQFASAPAASLTYAERAFLTSAASIQHISDLATATRALDSLSGRAYELSPRILGDQTAAHAGRIGERLAALASGAVAGPWQMPWTENHGFEGTYALDGQTWGHDAWLAPHLVIGGSVANGETIIEFDRDGGSVRGRSTLASMHVHQRFGRWHLTGLAATGRAELEIQRPIDVGDGVRHLAHARREFHHAYLHGELGHEASFWRGRLTPSVALGYATVHGDGFTERGDTGFELVGGAASDWLMSASFGMRYARDWALRSGAWTRLDIDARYRRTLTGGGDPSSAAFVGTPDARFDLRAESAANETGTIAMRLAGGVAGRWELALEHVGRFGNESPSGAWTVGVQRHF